MKILKHQQIPDGSWWRVWYLRGDRASGKTIAGVNFAHEYMLKGVPVLWITSDALRAYVVENILAKDGMTYHAPSRTVTHEDGGILQFSTSDTVTRFRGPNWGAIVWDDIELTQEQPASEIFKTVQLGLRVGDNPRMMLTASDNIPKWLQIQLGKHPFAYTTANIEDNLANLSPLFLTSFIK
jgi:phage terminase large subunit-like protein